MKLKKKPAFPDLIRHILVSWILAVAVEWFLLPMALHDLAGLEGLEQMSFLRVVLITLTGTAGLSVLSLWCNTLPAERCGLVLMFIVFSVSALISSFTRAFLGACILIDLVLLVFCLRGWDYNPERRIEQKKSRRVWAWIMVILSIVFFLFVSIWTVGRVYSFCCPSYDFGIFSQMFYSMAKTGLPMTTIERDGLLSHFAVHVSPIYYLMLPVYMLVPTPATLQVLQAAVMVSSVIPLWKIAKHHGLTGAQRMLICALLLLYPAFSGGSSYDIHENCFLTPLILWLFYGIDRKSIPITTVTVILTLAVKEDAAVYVAVIALWLTIQALLRKDYRNLVAGLLLLVSSLAWFFAVTNYLSKNGDGVMTYRYQNFMYDGSGSLLTVVKSVILNPLKAVYECVDAEKLKFLTLTMLPLLGLPLFTRQYERLILLIPYILVNLMPDYKYQHDIFFQYTFGSIACLFYLTIVNLSDLKINWLRVSLPICGVIVGATCFSKTIVPTAISYPRQAVKYYDYYQEIRDTLSKIPEDASVTAHTFYTTYLSQRGDLYDVRYTSVDHLLGSDYVVLKRSAAKDYVKYSTFDESDGYENLIRLLEENNYELLSEQSGLVIYKKR